MKEDNFSDLAIKSFTGASRASSLKKFLFSTGQNLDKSRKELNKIARSSRYKQWHALQKIKRILDKQKQNEQIQEQKTTRPDIGDLSHRKVKHLSHIENLKNIKKQIIAKSIGKGSIVTADPATIITKNIKAKRALRGMGKNKILVRLQKNLKKHKTYMFKENIHLDTQNNRHAEKETTDTGLSPKTKKVIQKAKVIKLRTNDIEINPDIHTKLDVDKTI